MPRFRHDPVTQTIHWLVALLVVGTYATGIAREVLPKGDFRTWLHGLHMSVGLVVMALTVLRLGWRVAAPRLEPAGVSPMLALAAKAGHAALYLALLAVPAAGLIMVWAKGRTIGFFGMPLPPLIGVDRGLAKLMGEAHEVAAHAMMLLAGFHAVAAIWHQVALRDGTLSRMVPQFGGRN